MRCASNWRCRIWYDCHYSVNYWETTRCFYPLLARNKNMTTCIRILISTQGNTLLAKCKSSFNEPKRSDEKWEERLGEDKRRLFIRKVLLWPRQRWKKWHRYYSVREVNTHANTQTNVIYVACWLIPIYLIYWQRQKFRVLSHSSGTDSQKRFISHQRFFIVLFVLRC